jgi:ABC-type nickel/cobalt efflux system permease component RcnA
MKMTDSLGSAVAAGLLGVLIVAGLARPAVAHPMGNFTISHYSELAIVPGELRLHYVLDMAEIPTVQERQKMDTDGNGKISRAESDAYLARAQRALPGGLRLRVNGARAPLTVRSATLAFSPGAGNLPTLKLHLRLVAPLSRRSGRLIVEYTDQNYRERTGWKEMVVTGGPGARIVETNAPATSLTNALASYPPDLLNAPPQQTDVRVVVAISAPAQVRGQLGQGFNGPTSKRFASRFTELLTAERLSWPILLVSLLIAFGLGAAHALEPGHGKTVVAAYLVGSRGTPKHAVWLGLIVTFTHTLGVFALGIVTLFASAYVVPDRLYPWIGAFSGLAITAVGLSLLWRHGRHAYAHTHPLTHDHSHPQSEHHHSHDHGHEHHHPHEPHTHSHGDHDHLAHMHSQSGHDHHHSHTLAHSHSHDEHGDHGHTHSHGSGGHEHSHNYEEVLADRGVRFGTLLALGVSGGIVPCPGALVVLLSALALHRVGFGLALIMAFSMGLAAVLTSIGLLMVSARGLLDRIPALSSGRWSERLALVSASVVSVLGLGIAIQSLVSGGLLHFPV